MNEPISPLKVEASPPCLLSVNLSTLGDRNSDRRDGKPHWVWESKTLRPGNDTLTVAEFIDARLVTKVSAARYHRGQQDASKAAAREAQGDVNWIRAEVMRLKKESAALASVASAYNRNLPPKTYWRDLPEDMQDQLSHVGISLDEFKGLIKSCKLTEDQFLDAAFRIDQRTKTADELADGLLDFLRDRIPPVNKTEPAKKTQS